MLLGQRDVDGAIVDFDFVADGACALAEGKDDVGDLTELGAALGEDCVADDVRDQEKRLRPRRVRPRVDEVVGRSDHDRVLYRLSGPIQSGAFAEPPPNDPRLFSVKPSSFPCSLSSTTFAPSRDVVALEGHNDGLCEEVACTHDSCHRVLLVVVVA